MRNMGRVLEPYLIVMKLRQELQEPDEEVSGIARSHACCFMHTPGKDACPGCSSKDFEKYCAIREKARKKAAKTVQTKSK